MNSFLPVLDLTPLLPSHLCKRVGNNAGHGGWSLVCRKDVNPHPQRCSTVNSDICTHHGCHFTAGRGHFGLLSAVPRRVHLPQGHASPHKGSDIDQGISADTTGAPAILLEDSRPQAILKLRPPIRLDYSTRNGCQPLISTYQVSSAWLECRALQRKIVKVLMRRPGIEPGTPRLPGECSDH